MSRRWVIGLIALGVLSLILMAAVAAVGTQLDQTRLDRDDLQLQVEDLQSESDALRQERDTVKTERDTLKSKADEQLQTIEQLKSELQRTGQSQAAPPGS